jgi:hypothetical protein
VCRATYRWGRLGSEKRSGRSILGALGQFLLGISTEVGYTMDTKALAPLYFGGSQAKVADRAVAPVLPMVESRLGEPSRVRKVDLECDVLH